MQFSSFDRPEVNSKNASSTHNGGMKSFLIVNMWFYQKKKKIKKIYTLANM